VRNNEGRFISEYGSTLSKQKDVFGHAQMGGLAATLAGYINSQTGLKTRGIELSLLQRASAHIMSGRDSEEAYRVGVDAVRYATVGHSDVMVAFERELKEEYCCKTLLRPLVEVANIERLLPQQYINRQKNNITDEFIKYALPLIEGNIDYPKKNGLPVYAKLKKMI
jgi:6-phosphofructokinase 1